MKKVMKVIAAGIVCTCIFCFGKAIRDKTAKVYQQFCEETEPEEWIDFNYWQNRNADVYAWIRIPGTKIDYPVVQGDEDGYYLSHDIDKESNIYGAIYTEKVNGKDFSSPNTVLYGHHMKDGSMFGYLDKYLDRDYFEKYNEVFLFTPEEINDYLRQIPDFVADSGGVIQDETEITPPLLTLSTCTRNDKQKRCLVQGILVECEKKNQEE